MSITDYSNFLRSLFPTGGAWKLLSGFDLTKLVDSFAVELERVDNRALQLIEEIDPRTTTELLKEYEKFVGLPEVNQKLSATIAQRKTDVVSKLTSYGAQTIAYFIELSSRLGIIISINEYRECKSGRAVCGDLLTNGDWRYAFKIITPEDISEEDLTRLRLKINKIKPAHTIAVFTENADPFLCGTNTAGEPLRNFY